jgi:lipid-binding SYLF domain-containing protein
VIKGAIGFGARWGKGLVSHRMDDGSWSVPSFINIGGGSFGLQLGVEAQDLVLVFTSHDGFRGLLKGKMKLAGTAAAAAGPYGRNAEAGMDILLRSAVVAYSRSKGLFAGISLDGSVVTIDDSANRKVFGKDLNGEDILLYGRAESNDVVMPFMKALDQHSPMANVPHNGRRPISNNNN